MKSSIYFFKVIAFVCVSVFLCKCQAPIEQEVLDSIEEDYYKGLGKISADSLNYDQLYDRALGLWDVQFDERDCKTQFGTAHVLVAGPEAAPPVVLMHGMNASSTSWYPNIAAIAENHRVYAIDFILEVNKSELVSDPEDGVDVMDWYREVFSCLGLEKFDLIGASRGGWYATKFAIENQNRIKKLVLLSPAQTFVWIPGSKKMLKNILYTLNPSRDDLRDALGALSNDINNIDQLYIDQYYRATEKSELDPSIFEMKPFSDDELANLIMPVLVMIGDSDFINNEKSLTKAEEKIENLKTVMVRDAGHFISIDQSEIINAEMVNFLGQN